MAVIQVESLIWLNELMNWFSCLPRLTSLITNSIIKLTISNSQLKMHNDDFAENLIPYEK